MVNWPLMKRKPGSRVAVKLNKVSVQCRTEVTVSVLKLDNDGSCAGKGEFSRLISLIGDKDKPCRTAPHTNEGCRAD